MHGSALSLRRDDAVSQMMEHGAGGSASLGVGVVGGDDSDDSQGSVAQMSMGALRF